MHTSPAIRTALYPKPKGGLCNDLYKNVQFYSFFAPS